MGGGEQNKKKIVYITPTSPQKYVIAVNQKGGLGGTEMGAGGAVPHLPQWNSH